jgi:iron complex transport system substrate-binding protein
VDNSEKAGNGYMKKKNIFMSLCLSAFMYGLAADPLSAREITDMAGKKVIVPDKISRVFSVSPAITQALLSLSPDLGAALNRGIRESDRRFYPESVLKLPVLGGSTGAGLQMNIESLLTVRPDVIIVWGNDGAYDRRAMESIAALKIPVVTVNVDDLTNYPDVFAFLGRLLDRQKRGNELSAYASRVIGGVTRAVSAIPAGKRLTVYYARMGDGLNTSCETSDHCKLIRLSGGINPVKCVSGSFTGMERVSLEQVMLFSPDAIVTGDRSFAMSVHEMKVWKDLRAVKSGRLYLIPKTPLSWFDGPPTYMELLGLQWLTGCLYPQYYHKDMEREAMDFIRLFFRIEMSKDEVRKIIGSKR